MGRFTGRPNGVILYEGPSMLDQAPIVVIATFATANEKTGNLIQTWTLRTDIHPVEAINNGLDFSICGDCPLRGFLERKDEGKLSRRAISQPGDYINRRRGCYVAVQNAPRGVWRAYKAGAYPVFDAEQHGRWFRGRSLRLGAYGEPVAAPLSSMLPAMELCDRTVGYTHQWHRREFQAWREHVMASTHSVKEQVAANGMGWRSYRTRLASQELAENEIICPASAEGGYRETCESCGACNGCKPGQDPKKRRNISIVAHGGDSRITGVLTVIEMAASA